MPTPLLVVDVQSGFLNDFTHHIPDRVARLIQRDHHDPILFTRFVNLPDSPYTRLLSWDSCSEEPETDLAKLIAAYAKPELIFSKPGLCGLPNELIDYLTQHHMTQIDVVGIDTDMCVLKIAMDLFDRGIEPIVLTDCCASTAGLQAHLAGLAVLSRNIGAQRLREAGLGDGSLAAPMPKTDLQPLSDE
ncbi:cysteine hydrolase family protein [Pantanalinema rosaneae CENA516]|uniref:cysteine hydrolase family protein n=1 Tax=Pantanalinema rosaneae TaxID=1620701 RepID=UPI003D6F457A